MKSSQYTPDHPEYVPLSAALMGSFIGGLLEGFYVFLLILGAGAVVSALGLSALSLSLYQATNIIFGQTSQMSQTTRTRTTHRPSYIVIEDRKSVV